MEDIMTEIFPLRMTRLGTDVPIPGLENAP